MAEKITVLGGGSELILGFMGDQLVHRDNARAQLNDLVIAHRRNNKKAQVTCILAIEPWTDTLSELADWALTSGFKLGLAGHDEAFEEEEIQPLLQDAAGNIYKLPADTLTGVGLVQVLAVWRFDSRLVVIADPDIDDNVYTAVEAAHGKNIPVRSLLHGLDRVVLETEDEEQEQVPMRVVEDPPEDGVEDEDLEEEEYDDEELEDSEEEDSEEEDGPDAEDYDDAELEEPDPEDEESEEEPDAEDEEDDEVADAELVEIEDEGEEDAEGEEEEETEVDDEVDADDEDAVEEDSDQSEEDEDEESEAEADEENQDEEEEEMPPVKAKTAEPKKKRLTEASLLTLAEKDRDAFYELAAKNKVYPGRGIKVPNMVARILEAQGGKAAAPKKAAAAPAKKAPAKKAPVAKTTAKKATPAAAVAKKAASAPAQKAKPAATKTVQAKRPTGASSNGTAPRVSQAKVKQFITLAKSALELAEELS